MIEEGMVKKEDIERMKEEWRKKIEGELEEGKR